MDFFSVGKNRPITFSLGEQLGAVKTTLGLMRDADIVKRLWAKDPTVWKEDPASVELIKNSLGWLTVPSPMRSKVEKLKAFANSLKARGFEHVVVLGMGGSSLAPELLSQTFESVPGYPTLLVLDSTDPDAISGITRKINPAKTVFVVSSKSGTTIEPLSFFEYFYALVVSAVGEGAGRNFIAITDSGSFLEGYARERGFAMVFLNPKDIGGRYSALSYFGIVPAVIAGIDVDKILHHAIDCAEECKNPDIEKNPAFFLGAVLASLAQLGKNKVTFLMSEEVEGFALWVEQLIAESTGKEGVGIIPIVGEPTGEVKNYGKDRVFVHIGTGFLEEHDIELLHYLEVAGHPIISMRIDELVELGSEFLRWEIATAVAGFVLGINPFDQPDVEMAKKLSMSLLESVGHDTGGFQEGIKLQGEHFSLSVGDSTIEKMPSSGQGQSLPDFINAFLGLLKEGDYIGILAYVNPQDRALQKALAGFRFVLRNYFKSATQFGYGPRYLHSTGQLHKGGADNGLFIVLLRPNNEDNNIKIPEKDFTFFDLESSQANGDLAALQARGRRVVFISVETTVEAALNEFYSLIKVPAVK